MPRVVHSRRLVQRRSCQRGPSWDAECTASISLSRVTLTSTQLEASPAGRQLSWAQRPGRPRGCCSPSRSRRRGATRGPPARHGPGTGRRWCAPPGRCDVDLDQLAGTQVRHEQQTAAGVKTGVVEPGVAAGQPHPRDNPQPRRRRGWRRRVRWATCGRTTPGGHHHQGGNHTKTPHRASLGTCTRSGTLPAILTTGPATTD